jgi:hypothetical protein
VGFNEKDFPEDAYTEVQKDKMSFGGLSDGFF